MSKFLGGHESTRIAKKQFRKRSRSFNTDLDKLLEKHELPSSVAEGFVASKIIDALKLPYWEVTLSGLVGNPNPDLRWRDASPVAVEYQGCFYCINFDKLGGKWFGYIDDIIKA